MIDLVIFDCDGVLVDSEIISCRVHAEMLTRHGYAITAEQVRDRFIGRSGADSNREVELELGRPLPGNFEELRRAEILVQLALSLQPIPHIAETLEKIDVQVCVASSGFPEKIAQSLRIADLSNRFGGHIFSAAQVKRGKPAPDLFLFAAEQMGADTARSLVIEDSVAGVTAAVAAGMTAFGFTGGSHCRPGDVEKLKAAGAGLVFDDIRQLPDLLERQKAGRAAGFSGT